MNPAKAAPSAPVKKAAREDPQILPGGLLILFFFFYLRWVRQFGVITTSTRKPMTSRIPVMPIFVLFLHDGLCESTAGTVQK